jgi:hypothetical protein
MANVTETSNFDAGIYQLETTDPLEGGNLGILNKASINTANRTRWLYDKVAIINAWIASVQFLLFLRKGTVSVGNIVNDKIITVSFANVGTTNYLVSGSLVSLNADYNQDNDVIWCIKNKTATSFQLCLREVSGANQSLNFDYVMIPF